MAIQQSRAIQQSNKRTRLLLILVYSMLYLPLKLRGVCILVLFSFRPVFWLKVFYSILLNFFRMPSMGGERRLYFIIKTFCIVKLEPFFYTTVYDTSYTNPIKKNYMSSIYTTPMQISVGHFKVWPYNNSTQQIKISYYGVNSQARYTRYCSIE